MQGEESVSAPGIESVGERNEGREFPSDVQGGTETAAAQTETEQVSQPIGDADNLGGSEIPNNEPVNEEGIGGAPSLLDVVRILYSKGKKVASKLFSMKFFDVAQTPKFMQELGLHGDKFTIKYGVIESIRPSQNILARSNVYIVFYSSSISISFIGFSFAGSILPMIYIFIISSFELLCMVMLLRRLPGDLLVPSYVTVMVSLSPGFIGSMGTCGTVQPHEAKAWCMYKSASPVFVKVK